MGVWFLTPDFTFQPDAGPFQLGTVIGHPKHPTNVLATPGVDEIPSSEAAQTLTEANHLHLTRTGATQDASLKTKLVAFASAIFKYRTSRRKIWKYEQTDHEIRILPALTEAHMSAILAFPRVKHHIQAGCFGKRPVYVVTGLRVTNSPFGVTRGAGKQSHAGISATGPAGGEVPVEVGGSVSGSVENATTDSYTTAPGIVFAYRLHIIRPKSCGPESEMWSSSAAFLTGTSAAREEPWEAAEVTADVLKEDKEEDAPFEEFDVRNGETYIRYSCL